MKPKDLGEPHPPSLQRITQMAALHRKTEYGVGFEDNTGPLDEVLNDPSTKGYFHNLFNKRIFHFAYININFFYFKRADIYNRLKVLKRIAHLFEDKKTPERPVYTILAGILRRSSDMHPAAVASSFKTIHRPDLFISRADRAGQDINMKKCRILPPTLLKPPQFEYYNFSLETGVAYVSGLDEKRSDGIGQTALSVSAAVFGRWYYYNFLDDDHSPGFPVGYKCYIAHEMQQEGSMAEVCKQSEFEVKYHKAFNIKYILNKTVQLAEFRIFLYDSPETLLYKLCMSKKAAAGVKYGLTAYDINHDDPDGVCGNGQFPLLNAMKKAVEFYKNSYKTAADSQKCLSATKD
ncbi:uncharacterized protein LOC144106766 [Amblyomma americanum]